jgi:hypothetical protein
MCNPPKNVQILKDAKLSPAMAERYQRAEGAQNNGFIGLGFFAAAIVSLKSACLLSISGERRTRRLSAVACDAIRAELTPGRRKRS